MSKAAEPIQDAWDDAQDLGQSAVDVVVKAPEKIVKTAQSVVRSINTTADNIIRNPLPTIETAVLISMGVPPVIASAAVTAANGGSMEQIALSAATSWAAAEIGGAVGEEYSPIETETLRQLGPQYADEALIKQIIVSSSGSAAVTALKGGSFEQVLKASVSGAVDGYINKSLKDSGYNNVDSKIISSATSAATRAILNGQDVGTAIGNSVAATTLSTAISGKVDQINKNNEVGQGLYDNYTSLKEKATDYFNTKVDPAQAEEKQNYAAYVAARDEYTKLKDQFDAQYKIWNDNKDSNVDAANSAADAANALTPKLNTASSVLGTATDTFKNSSAVAEKYRNTYTAEYVNTINDINTKITNINKENTALATDLGPLVSKYEQQAALDQSNIIKEVGASAVEEAQKVSEQQAKDAGFISYTDQQSAGNTAATEYYAQKEGYKSYADQQDAKGASPNEYYAQKSGFKSYADQQTAGDVPANDFYAQKIGFKNYADQEAAGDNTPADFYAQKEGYKNYADQQDSKGISAADFYAQKAGFKNGADQQAAGGLDPTEFYAQKAGYKSYTDQQEAKDLSPLDYYAQKAGWKSGEEQQTALSLKIDNPEDWKKYQLAQETVQWNADRSAKS